MRCSVAICGEPAMYVVTDDSPVVLILCPSCARMPRQFRHRFATRQLRRGA